MKKNNKLLASRLEDLTDFVYEVSRRCENKYDAEEGELLGVAWEGAYKAAKNYDESKGASLKTYAKIRMIGAIQDYFREMDWLSRSQRDKRNAGLRVRGIIQTGFNYDFTNFIVDEDEREPWQKLDRKQKLYLIWRGCPKRHCEMMKLRYTSKYTWNKISKVLNINESNVYFFHQQSLDSIQKSVVRWKKKCRKATAVSDKKLLEDN